MDLPTSRIKNTTLRFADNGDIEIFDNGYNTKLMSLSDDVNVGDYVAIITLFTEEDGHVRKLMKLSSDYIFQTLNRRTIINELNSKLKEKKLSLVDIGLYYKTGSTNWVGRHKVTVKEDPETNETLCSNGCIAA